MKIAVVGGSGFIGKQLVRSLCHEGHEVKILDIRADERDVPSGATISQCDIGNYDEARNAIRGSEAVFHLVGTVLNAARKNPHLAVELDCIGLANVLEACVKEKVSKVMYASSFYVYDGLSADIAVSEKDQPGILSAEMFGAVKMMGEKLVYEYSRIHKLEYVVLRFGPAYGPDPRCTSVIYDFLKAGLQGLPLVVWGSGSRKNQYTYVNDIATASTSALRYSNEVFNIISPQQLSLRDTAEALSRDHGFKAQYDLSKPEGPSLPYISASKAIKELAWKPTTLSEGVDETIKAIQSHALKEHVVARTS